MKIALLFISFLVNNVVRAEPLEWPSYGGGLAQTRFVDDASINTSNVKQLKLKFFFFASLLNNINLELKNI